MTIWKNLYGAIKLVEKFTVFENVRMLALLRKNIETSRRKRERIKERGCYHIKEE